MKRWMKPIKPLTEIPDEAIAGKARALTRNLGGAGSVVVALSGGVDSAVLLAAAVEACEQVLAVTASSPVHPRRETDEARRIARLVGCEHMVLKSGELQNPDFTRNPLERCYHCKRALFISLKALAAEKGFDTVVEGSNVDDLSDFRPGEKALLELGILSPLRQADLGKAEIRKLAGWAGLPNAGLPASACLASRFPYGVEITAEALRRVERLEDTLMGMGFTQVRVRCHADLVRLEVEPRSIARLCDPAVRDTVVQAARREGFRYVTIDLQGYRRGSLNPA
jgi:uncharacterized protein